MLRNSYIYVENIQSIHFRQLMSLKFNLQAYYYRDSLSRLILHKIIKQNSMYIKIYQFAPRVIPSEINRTIMKPVRIVHMSIP